MITEIDIYIPRQVETGTVIKVGKPLRAFCRILFESHFRVRVMEEFSKNLNGRAYIDN